MGKAKGRRRQEMGLADMAAPAPDPYEPERAGAEHRLEFDLLEFRVFILQWFDERGGVTDFVMRLSMEDDGAWVELLRIDCCHGEAHVHRFDRFGDEDRRVIRKIVVKNDVEIAHTQAEEMIYDQTELSKLRWQRGIVGGR